jgi:signal transduction histidine kinase
MMLDDYSRRPRAKQKSLSLSRRGAWGQFTVAATLITLLPTLMLAWTWKYHLDGSALPLISVWGLGVVIAIVTSLGYALLLKYPVNIVRLRRYLSTLADGGIPNQVTLAQDEDDLAAVQHHMERIVKIAEDRIQMLKTRHEVELEAERQRVMIESIGAMCHHLGQPATVMSMCIYRMKHATTPQEIPAMISDCEAALESMTQILDQLRKLSHYSSELYLSKSSGVNAGKETRIIKV